MSKPVRYLSAAAFILGLFSGCLAADDTPADKSQAELAEKVKVLIHALGSDNYGERANARRELYRIGRPAIEPLEYAAKSDDSELRSTANELLIALRGRGFMGINLREEPLGGEIADDDTPDNDKAPPRLVVKVLGVPSGRAMGAKKPFPAEAAGVETGDLVLEVNGRPICGVKDLMREVIYIGPNRVALVLIERNGKKLRLPLLLTHNPMVGDNPTVELEEDTPEPEKVTEKKPVPPPVETIQTYEGEKGTVKKK